MRPWGALLICGVAFAKGQPFELPKGWSATLAPKTATAAAPPDDVVYELQSKDARGSVTIYSGKISEAELELAASERHAAKLKNRAAWGVKAAAGPPREGLRINGRRAVRWRDRVGSALGDTEQLMTCALVGARLACVVTIAAADMRDQAEEAAALILSTMKR